MSLSIRKMKKRYYRIRASIVIVRYVEVARWSVDQQQWVFDKQPLMFPVVFKKQYPHLHWGVYRKTKKGSKK